MIVRVVLEHCGSCFHVLLDRYRGVFEYACNRPYLSVYQGFEHDERAIAATAPRCARVTTFTVLAVSVVRNGTVAFLTYLTTSVVRLFVTYDMVDRIFDSLYQDKEKIVS